MINKIKNNLYKLKLINSKNYLYGALSLLYKISNLKILKILSIFAYPKFKLLPKYYYSINNKLRIICNCKLKKKNILEIGGGEMYGMFPLFNNSKSLKTYFLIDPFVKNFVYKSQLLRYVLIKKISNKNFFIKNKDFEKFSFIKSFNQIKKGYQADFIFSVSCLEHVNDLNKLFNNIKKILSKKYEQYHIINFSNHLSKKKPFKHLYENHPNDFKKKFNNKINFLRISDYKKILDKYFYNYKFYYLDKVKVQDTNIHPFWKKKYDINELSIRTAILKITN